MFLLVFVVVVVLVVFFVFGFFCVLGVLFFVVWYDVVIEFKEREKIK